MLTQTKLLKLFVFLAFTLFHSVVFAAPSDFITRAKFTEWVIVAADINVSSQPVQNPFDDVPVSHPQYRFIHTARALHLVSGYENTNLFGPDDNILKKEAAKILLGAFGNDYLPACKQAPFVDVSVSDWACRYIKELKKTRAISGILQSDGRILFEPDTPLNKAVAAKMVAVLITQERGVNVPFGYIHDDSKGQLLDSYAQQVFKGTLYEQPVNEDAKDIEFTIHGSSRTSSEKGSLYRMASNCDTCTYYWEASNGRLEPEEDNLRTIRFIPSAGQERVYLYGFISDGVGSTSTIRKEIQVTDVFQGGINSAFSAGFNASDENFILNYQVNEQVDYLLIEHSFDQQNWDKSFERNVTALRSGNQPFVPDNFKAHSRIYFRLSTRSEAQPLQHEPIQRVDYEIPDENRIERPVSPKFFPLPPFIGNEYVDVTFRKVLDSKLEHNADYYELIYADNYLFSEAKSIRVEDTTAGENLYESLTHRVEGLQDNTQYYFKVRGIKEVVDDDDIEGRWSINVKTKVELQDLPVFDTTYQFPEDKDSDVSKTPRLCWSASDEDGDDLEYSLLWGTDSNDLRYSEPFNQGAECFNFATQSQRTLLPGQTYYWQVLVREDGKYRDSYEGGYIASPVWSFTTISEGQDLAISGVSVSSDSLIIPEAEVTLDVIVTNLGSEPAKAERLQAFYHKDGKASEFRCCTKLMPQDLAAGESVTFQMKVRFDDEIETGINGEIFDNILVQGSSQIRLAFQFISEQDVKPGNNEYFLDIEYNDQGAPEITNTLINLFGQQGSKGLYVRQGSDIRVIGVARDDFNLVSLAVYYQLSPDAPWELIYIEDNNDDDDISYAYNWRVPEDVLAAKARIKFVAIDSNGQVAEKLSPEFRIASNNISGAIDDLPTELNVGETVTLRVSTEGDYPIESYWVNLIASDNVELIDFTQEPLPPSLKVQIPQNNNLAISNAHFEVNVIDFWGNELTINSNSFELLANTQAEGPVAEILQLREATVQPPGATSWTENYAPLYQRVDSQGNKHVIMRSDIRYWLTDSDSSTPDELEVIEDNLYYQQISSEGIKGSIRLLPEEFDVLDFRLDGNDKGYLLLEREQQLAVVEIEGDIPSEPHFIFNQNSPSISARERYDTGFVNHSLLNQGYLLNGYWYHLKNVRSAVKRYPFNSGRLGREETLSLNTSLNRFYEANFILKATHLDNTLYFIDEAESRTVWIDTLTGNAGEVPLPFSFDSNIDGDFNKNKSSLFTWQNNVYLSMRGTLYRFTGNSWATVTQMYLNYFSEQALLTQDNYQDWKDEIERFEVVPTDNKLFVFVEFDSSGSKTHFGLTYPQFQEKDVFELNTSNGGLLNITVEDEFRHLNNYKSAVLGFEDQLLHLSFDDASAGNSPDVHFWVDKINPATGSFARSTNQLISESVSRDTRPSLASYRLFRDEADGQLYAVAWGKLYQLSISDHENELTYYTTPALYEFKGDVYISHRFGDGPYDGRFSHMSGNNFRSYLFDPDRRVYRNQNLTTSAAVKPFFAQGAGFIAGREFEVVSGNHFYNHGDIYPLADDDFVVTGEKTCSTGSYYDVAGVSSHPDFQFIEYKKSPDRLELYSSDCALYATLPVVLESNIRDFHFSQANADYVVAAFEDTNLTINIYRYHLATQQTEVFVLPQTTRSYPNWRNFDANEALQFGLSWGGSNSFYAYGEFGGDIVAPTAELQVSSQLSKPGDVVQLSWSSPEAHAQLGRATVIVIDAQGNRSEIFTTTSEFFHSIDYQIPINTTGTELLFELALEDTSRNIGYAQQTLAIEQPISMESFSVDRTAVDEGEIIYVSWKLLGKRASENTKLVLVNQFNNREVEFIPTTEGHYGLNTDGLSGQYRLRLDIRDFSFVLPQSLEIGGTHINFIYDEFGPKNDVFLANQRGTLTFTWQTDVQATSGWLARVFLKSIDEDIFREIGDSDSNQFNFAAEDMVGEYQWYVEFTWQGIVFTSQVQHFVIQPLPEVNSVVAQVVDPTAFRPRVNVTWNAAVGAESYFVFLQTEDGRVQQLTETNGTEYVYDGGQYFELLSFGVSSAVRGSITNAYYSEQLLIEPVLPSSIRLVEESLDNPSEGAVVSVTLMPELAYANIEFILQSFSTFETIVLENASPETAFLPALQAGETYLVEARAKYPNGDYVPSVNDTEVITVSFDYGVINQSPELSIAMQNTKEIGLTWSPTNNAESYQLTRYTPDNAAGEVLLTTAAHQFTDDSIALNQAYRYQLVAQNPLSQMTSELTPWVHDQVPIITAPRELTVVTNEPSGISVEHPSIQALISSVSVSDDITNDLVLKHNLPLMLSEGEFTAVFTATDEGNNVATASVVISVVYESLDILRNAKLEDAHLTACLLESYADTTLFTDITTLACSNKGISSLAGIDVFTELRVAQLANNAIVDLTTLSGLPNIRELNLSGNQLNSLVGVSNLQGLVELDVSGNDLTSISTIKDLRNLAFVNASSNNISDIATLLSGVDLPATINLVSNGIQCEQLYRLDLLGEVQNLNVQSDYNADQCDADSDGLSDAVERLNRLDPLNPADASADFDGDGFSNLDEINAGTDFNDAGSYPGAGAVDTLNDIEIDDVQLQQCLVSQFPLVTPLTQINQLSCDDMAIVSLSGLQQLTSLRELSLKNNQVVNIAVIDELNSLRLLDLSGNLISDFSALNRMLSLTSLKLDNTGASELGWLSELTNLDVLSVAGNQIRDITPLLAIDSLKELDLSRNQIVDINTLLSQSTLPEILIVNGNAIDCVTLLTLTERARDQGSQLVSDYAASCVTNNSAPTVEDMTVVANFSQGNVLTIALLGVDADGDELSFKVVDQPLTGSIVIENNVAVYTFNDSAFVGDQFTFVANDGLVDSEIATVFIISPEENSPPVIDGTPQTEVIVGEFYQFIPSVSDVDGDSLTFSVENLPHWADFSNTTGEITGLPSNEDVGVTQNITIRVSDGVASVSLDSFNLQVLSLNTPPTGTSLSQQLNEDTTVRITPDVFDSEGDTVTFQILQAPTNGSLLDVPNGWIFSPILNYVGMDEFVYQISDGESVSEPITVSLTILSVNDNPVANDDSFSLDKQTSGIYILDVLANDVDVDLLSSGDSLLVQNASANIGSVAIVDNQIQYTALSNYIGDVLIDYIVVDSAGEFDQASVLLSIIDANADSLPVINVPSDITLNATGLFTLVNPGLATAEDVDGNQLPVFMAEGDTLLPPGKHEILWQTEDRFGNRSSKAQVINIYPLVNLGQEQVVAEGSRVLLPVSLNGKAPEYPMSVTYSVQGAASGDGNDHNLVNGTAVFTSGRTTNIEFDVFVDSEIESIEDIVVVLGQEVNAGLQSSTRVWITESNIAPEVSLKVVQAGQERALVSQSEGAVLISANTYDSNIGDSLSLEWHVNPVGSLSGSSPINTGQNNNEFVFSPELVDVGVYRITAVVTDSGAAALTDSEHVYVEVVAALATLTPELDSDGDLVPDIAEGYLDLDGDGIPAYIDSRSECNVVPGIAGAETEYFLEAQSGVCMREGRLAATSEQNGLALQSLENTVVADSNTQLTGELFDFEIYGLPVAGKSSYVVIPQVNPIPTDARYRKYNINSQTWFDFVVDDNNKVYSASNEQGACPSPGNRRWQEGLIAGNWCVQLLIQDGGPNDSDGTADGGIADPGGIAIDISDNLAPVVTNDAITIRWNTMVEVDVLANDEDPDGGILAINKATVRLGEVEILSNGKLRYQAPLNFAGEDIIRYYAVDEDARSAVGEAIVTILPNRPPVANGDNVQTNLATTIEIDPLVNDQDIDGDTLVLLNAEADTGVVDIVNNKIQFTPANDSPSSVNIIYSVTDGEFTATASIFVTVLEDGMSSAEPPTNVQPGMDRGASGGSMGMLALLLTLIWLVRRSYFYR